MCVKNLDIDMNASVALTAKQFKSLCSERTKYVFVENWHTVLHDKTLLRSYRLYKNEFSSECYLDYINVHKFAYHYQKLEPVPTTWKLNVDGIHDLKTNQNNDCVLGVLRSRTKNILSPGVKSMPTNVKFYIQRLDPSTQNFRILVTTNNLYFSCPAKTGRY